ncbi:UNVERIFIED_CONTAM: hypothetical protein Sradi_5616400 [Sesamum radiatum]|uniref:RNase H type-1 domain-containing protein n=1 Tax=Sesamum radiatum TaxID=300843 RepID=A0AAW2L1P0_SESRA
MSVETDEEITFGSKDLNERQGKQDDPMVVKLDIANFSVHKVLIDNGSSTDIIFWDVIKRMGLEDSKLSPVQTPLIGFRGSEVASMGTIDLPASVGEEPRRRTTMCHAIKKKRKWYYNLSLRKGKPEEQTKRKEIEEVQKGPDSKRGKAERMEPTEEYKLIELIIGEPDKTTRIGINLEVIVHRLNVDLMMRPIKQKKRSFGAERNHIIEEEVNKLMEAGYVSEVQYTGWLVNIVIVLKASRKWRMCTDFTDLNKVCPKDPYPLPQIYLLVDSTAGYELFSAIYQRLVNRMFKDQIGATMEVYVDDMLVKRKEEDHLKDLEQAFGIMRSYRMKLNPNKCTFGVRCGKFLGYMVSEKGIEANPEMIEVITRIQSPTTLKELQKLTEFTVEQIQEKNESWLLHVDGSSNASNGGAGILLQGPNEVEIEVAARLLFAATNNEAEYEALVLGLQLAWEAGARELNVCTDSQLVAMQEVTLPDDPIQAKRIKFKAPRFTMIGDELYKRTIGGPLLKCVDGERARYVLREIHEGSYGNHSGGRSLAQKVTRQGYFWPTLVKGAIDFAKNCESCQRYAALIHTSETPIEPIKIACPFDQ